MKLLPLIIGAGLALESLTVQAQVELFEWAVNQDGVLSGTGDPAPAGFNVETGLGTVSLLFTGVGPHSGFLFLDHELSEDLNTFFNEIGSATGTPAVGESWEIDEPGFHFGDIYENFLAGTPDNSVGTAEPDDVSMLMGRNFYLDPGETGLLQFILSETQPANGFYLTQLDPDSGDVVYFSSHLAIRSGGTVPDAAWNLGLMIMALAGLTSIQALWFALRKIHMPN